MKTLSTALAGALALIAAAPAAAQSRHGAAPGARAGGWSGGHAGPWAGHSRGPWTGRSPGSWSGRPSGAWSGARWSANRGRGGYVHPGGYRGRSHFRGYVGYPYYFGGGFAAGYVTALALSDPWYGWGPFYGGWYGDEVTVTHDYDYPSYDDYPPPQVVAPPACGSWAWDEANQTYHWLPCAPPSAPGPG